MSKEEEEIMKLGPEHVGKMVKKDTWAGAACEMLAICDEFVWVKDGSGPGTYPNDNWEIIEPEKKPSERINEQLTGMFVTTTGNIELPEWFNHMTKIKDAICRYLDEEFEKRKGK